MRLEGIFPKAGAGRIQTKRLQRSRKVTRTASRQEVNQSVFKPIWRCLKAVVERAYDQVRERVLLEDEKRNR